MNKYKKIIAIICARKNSKSLKNKNLKKLNGKPLIFHTIKAAKNTKKIKDIYVSTDSIKIAQTAKKFGAKVPFLRPKKLATDITKTDDVLRHALLKIENKNNEKIDYVVYLQVTEPLRPKNIITKCINKILSHKLDTVFAAKPYKKNIWFHEKKKIKRLNYFEEHGLPRQKKKLLFREDTGVACVSKAKIIRTGKRIGKKVGIVSYNHDFDYIDIHNKNDLLITNYILKNKLFKNF
ncbi:MAG: acylneuraminate cytidylyltransferase [Crocinitomicaceae bacterium]|nr:acylneuraminate cytidylyltransferase [Crocinitomicaceae bacterium]